MNVSNVLEVLRNIAENIRCVESGSDGKHVLFVVEVALKLGFFAGAFALMETLPKEKYSDAIFERFAEHIGEADRSAKETVPGLFAALCIRYEYDKYETTNVLRYCAPSADFLKSTWRSSQ